MAALTLLGRRWPGRLLTQEIECSGLSQSRTLAASWHRIARTQLRPSRAGYAEPISIGHSL